MSFPPKAPPRFVPTLTDVVHGPDEFPASVPQDRLPEELEERACAVTGPAPSGLEMSPVPASHAAQEEGYFARHTGTTPIPAASSALRPLQQGMEEFMVHRVMQRVDVVLDHRLREAISLVVQEQTRSVLPRLREEIESVVRHAVYEAVADELASVSPPQPES